MGRYRLILKSAEITNIDNDLWEVRVTLNAQEKIFTGSATGKNDPDERLRLAVNATLNALGQALTRPIKFDIASIALREIGAPHQKFVVVLLKTDYFIQPVGEAIELLGSCKLSDSEIDSAARATLNATNRAISLLLK